ncbi:unnamed protein product [Sphagnum balticum]
MADLLFQGPLDAFLAKVRAKYDAVENQAARSFQAIKDYNLVSSDPMANSLFTEISNVTDEGDRAVWRHTYTTGAQALGSRHAGGAYPNATFLKGYETTVFDPDNQIAGQFVVAEERQVKEGVYYQSALDRAQKLMLKVERYNIADPFEVFNLAFTQPGSYPGAGQNRFFGRGNFNGLNEPLISTQHARIDGGAAQSNAILTSGLSTPFSDTAFWAAREQAATFVDDVGDAFPTMGGKVSIVAPPANSLVRTALELNGGEWKVQTANNDINVHEGELVNIYSSPYLLQSFYSPSTISNKKAWFLVDTSNRDPQVGTGLVKLLFVPFSSRVEWQQDIDSVVYKVKYEPVYGYVDWWTIVGSLGDNSAYTN